MKKNIFIDCGFHHGEGLTEFTAMLNINENWDVYTFEANPQIDIQKYIVKFPFKVTAFNKAVWIDNKKLIFNIQNNHGQGSCLNCLSSTHTYTEQIQVDSINFSEFILSLKNNNIFCKMDIEGAEFCILEKLINDNTLSLINTLWVEWHDVDLKQINEEYKTKLKTNIEKQTILYDWH